MRWALFALLAACGSTCPLPVTRSPHRLALAVIGADWEVCFSQTHDIDLTSGATLAQSFASDCTSSFSDIECGGAMLSVSCPSLRFSCEFAPPSADGISSGTCINDFGAVACHYDALLTPLAQ